VAARGDVGDGAPDAVGVRRAVQQVARVRAARPAPRGPRARRVVRPRRQARAQAAARAGSAARRRGRAVARLRPRGRGDRVRGGRRVHGGQPTTRVLPRQVLVARRPRRGARVADAGQTRPPQSRRRASACRARPACRLGVHAVPDLSRPGQVRRRRRRRARLVRPVPVPDARLHRRAPAAHRQPRAARVLGITTRDDGHDSWRDDKPREEEARRCADVAVAAEAALRAAARRHPVRALPRGAPRRDDRRRLRLGRRGPRGDQGAAAAARDGRTPEARLQVAAHRLVGDDGARRGAVPEGLRLAPAHSTSPDYVDAARASSG